MNIPNLLHSLTNQGLTLSLGEAPDSIAVVGPVASLTLEQQRALAEHKPTLLAMLTPLPTCYIPEQAGTPEDLGSLNRCMEYFERLADEVEFHNPERLAQIVLEPEQQESPCRRCGNRTTYLAILHAGESLRRDCAKCGRFIDFPSWHNREDTAKILADTVAGSRYNEKASCPSAENTQAGSDDLLSQEKETANG
jgi:hypothetical protein